MKNIKSAAQISLEMETMTLFFQEQSKTYPYETHTWSFDVDAEAKGMWPNSRWAFKNPVPSDDPAVGKNIYGQPIFRSELAATPEREIAVLLARFA